MVLTSVWSQVGDNEALLFCNLIRSYLSILLAEHERLCSTDKPHAYHSVTEPPRAIAVRASGIRCRRSDQLARRSVTSSFGDGMG